MSPFVASRCKRLLVSNPLFLSPCISLFFPLIKLLQPGPFWLFPGRAFPPDPKARTVLPSPALPSSPVSHKLHREPSPEPALPVLPSAELLAPGRRSLTLASACAQQALCTSWDTGGHWLLADLGHLMHSGHLTGPM